MRHELIDLTGRDVWPSNSSRPTPCVDIVAVHGLHEDAWKTWTDPATGILWLKDLFPHQQRAARILLYSYDGPALITPGTTSDSLSSLAGTLVVELQANRYNNDAIQRPIVFICHGFGGILVKRALTYAETKRSPKVQHLRSIYVSTYGIVFMGTPHHGIKTQALSLFYNPRLKEGGPNQFMISLLDRHPLSELLLEVTNQFAPLIKRFSIYYMWEQQKTSNEMVETVIVDEASAAPIDDESSKYGISKTHSGMTKFSDIEDPGYQVLLATISRYIADAPRTVQARWKTELEARDVERQLEAQELRCSPYLDLSSQPPSPTIATTLASSKSINQYFEARIPIKNFTGRTIQAAFLRDCLGSPVAHDPKALLRIFIICGMGGSGKTQFALKYASDNRERYWAVFFVDGSSLANLQASFAQIAQNHHQGDSSSAALYWLARCSKPWLLIVDNADDPEIEKESYLADHLPSGGNGHVLITTRIRTAVKHANSGQLELHGMDPEEAIVLLLNSAYPDGEEHYKVEEDRTLAGKIAAELGFLALALTYAGATIRKNIYTLKKYLDYYLGNRKRMLGSSSLKSQEEINIVSTWEIPFKRITVRRSTEHIDAVDLVHLFAFLHFQFIPDKMLWIPLSHSSDLERSVGRLPSILQFGSGWQEELRGRVRAALRLLSDHSIIDLIIDPDPDKPWFCSLHPVVHEWTRQRLSKEQENRWRSIAIAVVANCISPNLEESGRGFRSSLIPHINSCLTAIKFVTPAMSFPSTTLQADALERFASVFAENGDWKEARMWEPKVIDFRLRSLGKWHADTIRAQRNYANTLWNLFEIKAAGEIQYRLVMRQWWSRPQVSDWYPFWLPEHVSYCLALDDLTRTLWLAGWREKSRWTGERAVSGLTKHLGEDDPRTLTAKFNLARTYLHLGYVQQSYDLLQMVVEGRQHFFGSRHLDTLMAKDELGMTLCHRKQELDLDRAEALITEVHQARKAILGEHHAYTLWSVNNLAKVFCERGAPQKAISMLEGIIDVVTDTLGDRHVGMSMTLNNLVMAYIMSQDWAKAEEKCRRVLEISPPDHPDSMHTKLRLAQTLIQTGRVEEAEQCCTELLDLVAQNKSLKADDPLTIAAARQLRELYRRQARNDDAIRIEKLYPASVQRVDQSRLHMPYSKALKLDQPTLTTDSSNDHRIRISDNSEPDDELAAVSSNSGNPDIPPTSEIKRRNLQQPRVLEMPSPEVLARFERLMSMTPMDPDSQEPPSDRRSSPLSQLQGRIFRMPTY